MTKIDIDIIKMAITQEVSNEISKEKIDRIIAKAVEIAKGFEEPKEKPPKKQYVFVAYDKDKRLSLINNVCEGAIFKIPENASPESVIELVKQAKEETFEKFLPNTSMMVIVEGQKEGDESKARIVFSTYQSMLSIIKDTSTCPYGIGHFDLIIVDEAHRSLFNKYAEIFEYFDALMIGLTATPRNDIHKSTYKVFNLDTEMPNYEYDLVKGVKDGYLRLLVEENNG